MIDLIIDIPKKGNDIHSDGFKIRRTAIDMVDLRYYLNNVSALTENSYDEVLILYGISNMCEANDLAILQ